MALDNPPNIDPITDPNTGLVNNSWARWYFSIKNMLAASSIQSFSVLIGTSNNNIQSVTPNGTAGQVLFSNGVNLAPSWQSTSFVARTYNAINSATILTSSNWAQTQVCTGSTAYTVTLPAVSANKWIEFWFQPTSSALVSIAPPAGTINGKSSIVFGANEGCLVWSDGTNWYMVNSQLQPVIARAYKNAGQTITHGTTTKVQLDATTFDIGSFWDGTTNYRYTPKYPGKYRIYFQAQMSSYTNTGVIIVVFVYKNGSEYARTAEINTSTNGNQFSHNFCDVDLNGSTDYIECFINFNDANDQTIQPGSNITYADISRISNF